MHDDERRLAERLRRYESRISVGPEPPAVSAAVRIPAWALAAVAAGLVIVAVLAANVMIGDRGVGNASPTPRSSVPSAEPSLLPTGPGQITDAELLDAGRRLVVEFGGYMESCTDYEADTQVNGDTLEILVTPTEDVITCRLRLDERTLTIDLDPPFAGTSVRDLATGRLFAVGVAAATATPAASATEQPPAPATPEPLTVEWESSVIALDEGADIRRITSEGGRFWALGSVGGDAVIWSSPDGQSWDHVTLPFPHSWERLPQVYIFAEHLASVGDRLLAVGTVGAIDYLNVVVWESNDDGRTWAELATGAFMEEAFKVNDITNGPTGIVVAAHGPAAGLGSAWRSTDGGLTWTEHPPPGQDLGIRAVVGTSSRYVMAGMVGAGCCGDLGFPRIWTSVDGATWTEASLEGGDRRGLVHALTIDGEGRWVAVGLLDERIVTWRSSDGMSWTLGTELRPARPVGYEELDAQVLRLIGHPEGFVIFDGGDPFTSWTSRDGAEWTSAQISTPAGLAATAGSITFSDGIARIGDTLIVSGASLDSGGSGPSFVWIGEVR